MLGRSGEDVTYEGLQFSLKTWKERASPAPAARWHRCRPNSTAVVHISTRPPIRRKQFPSTTGFHRLPPIDPRPQTLLKDFRKSGNFLFSHPLSPTDGKNSEAIGSSYKYRLVLSSSTR